jgi:dihydrofolate reductase
MKNMIVAYDKHYGIGAKNDLMWHRDLPDDQKRFKELTTGNAIIMGHKTYESIGRLLPNRQSIIISRKPLVIEGATVVHSLEAAYVAVEPHRESFVIGGGQIYALALATVDRIFVTEVDATFNEADIFFPKLDASVWHETERVHCKADERNLYDYDFVTYERR